jgi:hypothetical protein
VETLYQARLGTWAGTIPGRTSVNYYSTASGGCGSHTPGYCAFSSVSNNINSWAVQFHERS